MPEPQPVPLPLKDPVPSPSSRPNLPDLNPAQKPKNPPLLPFPIPPPSPYLPPSPTPPAGLNPSPTGLRTGTGTRSATGGTTSTKLPAFPSGFKIPQSRPNLKNAKNIKPEQEPCKCNLAEDEDYMIAKIQQIQVPIVVQQGIPPLAVAVEKFITVPVVAIKGVSNAGEVVQQYQQRADLQRKAIANLNKSAQNFSAIGALSTAINAINLFLNNQVLTRLDKIRSGVKLLADNPLVDRAMSTITMILAVHNAVQLSNNIGMTVTETIDMGLELVGFQWKTIDDDGNEQELSPSEVVGKFWTNSVISLIGSENFTNLSIAWKKANRIYQATANTLDAVQGIFDAGQQLNEITASMTGKMGNALKRAGVVKENAFEWFDEKFEQANANSRKYPLFEKLQRIQNATENLEEIASNTVSVRDSINELNESRDELSEAVEEAKEVKREEWEEEKRQSEIKADLSTLELDKLDED
ncbi:MAG: hypothetical protein AAGA60_32930 [Cyanobacteria bacterium P01_E01_bin.42]